MTTTADAILANSSLTTFRQTIAPLPTTATARAYRAAADVLVAEGPFPTIDEVCAAIRTLDPATLFTAAEVTARCGRHKTFRRWSRDYLHADVAHAPADEVAAAAGRYLRHKLAEYFATSYVGVASGAPRRASRAQ